MLRAVPRARSRGDGERGEQGYSGESGDKRSEKCDKRTYHNAIAMLGLIMQRVKNDLEKASILYSTVLRSDPDHVLTLDHKCSLLTQQGQRDEAMKLHKRVCSLDPTHTKKSCAYLESLFPKSSDQLHDLTTMQDKLVQFEDMFSAGARRKTWTAHPWRSLKKKIARNLC